MRADFVANASHELRTPLASLRGFVETLQGAAKDDAQARERFLKVMGEQAERMTRLIDDLLSLSRVEMREHLPPAERVDLNDAVAHVIQSLQPIAGQAGTTIEFRRLEAPAVVRGDSDEIVQVFQNLVQNAIKYGKRGGRIDVALAREPAGGGRPARFVVAVTDDGPGIAPQHLPRLTERFYRVSVAASREKGGTGLGPRHRQAHPQPASRRARGHVSGWATARPLPSSCRRRSRRLFAENIININGYIVILGLCVDARRRNRVLLTSRWRGCAAWLARGCASGH